MSKKHHDFFDTLARMARQHWGSKFDSQADAEKDLMKSPEKMTAWCLMTLARDIGDFKQALTQGVTDDRIGALVERFGVELDRHIKPKEERHGPCPDSVWQYFRDEMLSRIGRSVAVYGEIPHWHMFMGELPEKGSPVRKEYDKWMKRKVKKEKSSSESYPDP